jgi:small ligand-binding sensory domain FIST
LSTCANSRKKISDERDVTIATGFAANNHAVPELAAVAVKDALANAGSAYAHSVILFLSGHFAHSKHSAQHAVTAASRAAGCLQVTGCTVPGVFTEKAWALDQPAAAALVMCGAVSLGPPHTNEARLSFALPSKLDPAWITDGQKRFGTLATDGDGEADGQVWTQGKLVDNGYCETALHGAQVDVQTHSAISRGIRVLSSPLEVTDSDNFEILQLGEETALDSLLRRLDPETRKLDTLPPQRIFAAIADPGIDTEQAMQSGRYTLIPILRVNRDERSVTLAAALPLRTTMWWTERDAVTAEKDTGKALIHVAPSAGHHAIFGLMFCCIGRGPYFYQGQDRDMALTRNSFPDLPLLGAYGAGEIAPFESPDGSPGNSLSKILSYSTVLTIATVADNHV